MKKEILSEKELYNLYIKENKSKAEIARELSISPSVVTRLINKYQIRDKTEAEQKALRDRVGRKYHLPKEDLYRMFIIENKTVNEIAGITKMSRHNVSKLLRDYNIENKNRKMVAKRAMETQNKLYGGTGFQINRPEVFPFQDPEWQKSVRKNRDDAAIGKKISETFQNKTSKEKEDFSNHIKNGLLEKYGVSNIKYLNVDIPIETKEQMISIINSFENKPSYAEIAELTGYSTNSPIIQKVKRWGLEDKIDYRKSPLESKIADFLDSNGIKYTRNDRNILAPKELDFVIEDKKIAIEVNDTWTHNSTTEHFQKDKKYHLNKTQEAKEKGYYLIHIFEYELNKIDLVLSPVLDKKRIFARKCKVMRPTPKETRAFLEKYHRQGAGSYCSINVGLEFNGELVQVMNFRRARNSTEGDYELYRLCSKNDIIVVGGASKLFSHSLGILDSNKIYSYCDMAHNLGGVYEKLGFHLLRESEPNYKWVHLKKQDVLSRESTMKHKLVEAGFDPNKTEKEIMVSRGYVQVFDSGNQVWYYYDKG